MKLTHIDNNFYRLTAAQAKQLCMDRKLPRLGYETKADPVVLATVKLGHIDHRRGPEGTWVEFDWKTPPVKAWVTRTPLSWWHGARIEKGWSWALHVCS